ncbi:MAG: ABC transporter permease [Oscillospiraceae bacterium]|nr:ABC transporter permease [Oscillospiraceae bacterium]MBR6430283.1 ABC transporter permease [Oscillospiraceae bacterium]
MIENIILAFQSVWAHKVRSILTMLGIIIGIASIITIVSTIKGTNEQIKKNLVGSGVNAVVISLYQEDYQYSPYGSFPDNVAVITEKTRQELADLGSVKDASVFLKRDHTENAYYQNTAFSGSLFGVDLHYFDVYNYNITWGRGFTQADFDGFKKVVILDRSVCSNLFSGADPIGKTMEIGGDAFTVIGVAEQASSSLPVINSLSDYYTYMSTNGGSIFIPAAVWPVIYSFDEPQSVAVSTERTDDMTRAGRDAANLLTERQILSAAGNYSYKSIDLLEQAKRLQEMSTATNRQLVWIAGISLIVGGIGVMNIMLVTVSERTHEIGLKKAIGAKKKRIRAQFLTEAAVLTSLGGILGVIFGIGLAKLLSSLSQTPSAISVPAILIAVVFSMAIGILFGLIPAVKASNLNPIEALRRE